MEPVVREMAIPLPEPIYRLAKVFRKRGRSLHGVGGAFRDYLMEEDYFRRFPDSFLKRIKDVDLATEAHPREVAMILDHAGIRNFEKGESFGVWVAHIGGEDFEIATFREDIGGSDGRHPDEVRFCTPEGDYKRRDFTINALFYQIPDHPAEVGKLIDFGGGVGFEHIEQRKIVAVGNASERFAEDKLRALRAIRFFCRFCSDRIDESDHIDPAVVKAIYEFRDLRGHGISGPRIMTEFYRGLGQARNKSAFLHAYLSLGLLPAVFPGLDQTKFLFDGLGYGSGLCPDACIAYMLRSFEPEVVREELRQCNYPGKVFDAVAGVLQARLVFSNPKATMEERAMMAGKFPPPESNPDVHGHFGQLVKSEVDFPVWEHARFFKPLVVDGEALMKEHGLTPGPAVGKKIRELQTDAYMASLYQRRVSSV